MLRRYWVISGLLNPLPVAPTLRDQNDITIAVNVDARPDRTTGSRTSDKQPESPDGTSVTRAAEASGSYSERIKTFIQDLQGRFIPEKQQDWGFFDVMMLSIETMQSSMVRMKMAPYTPDYYLVITSDAARAYDFHRASELIQLSRDTAERYMSS